MSYRLVEKQLLYSGQRMKLEVHHLEAEETFVRAKREVVVHPGAVTILPFLDVRKGSIILIRNRRYSIGQILLELPAGTLEKNEDAINCVGCGLFEESAFLAAL